MRKLLIFTFAITLATSSGAQAQPYCTPDGPPTKPVNSEDYNPGYGGSAGLNDDFHDDLSDPLDAPGTVISVYTRDAAQDEIHGGVHLLRDLIGNDCSQSGD